jgi:hypothetical protein
MLILESMFQGYKERWLGKLIVDVIARRFFSSEGAGRLASTSGFFIPIRGDLVVLVVHMLRFAISCWKSGDYVKVAYAHNMQQGMIVWQQRGGMLKEAR